MALSGSIKTGNYQGRYYTLSWTATQSAATNKSTISWEITCAGGQADWYAERTLQAVINGVVVHSKTNRVERYAGSVAKGTIVIEHNAEGERSFSASLRVAVYVEHVNCTGSGSFTLNTIARASQPSLVTWPETTNDVGDFGVTFSIHMNRAADIFTHTVRYEYGNRKGTIATGVTTGTTWAVPLDFMNDIPESTSASGRIYVDTYNGSTLIGTKYTGFTVTVPASIKPSCTFTLDDITGVDDIYGSPVKGLSKIKVVVTGKTAYSSPIASTKITANGVQYTGTEATTGVLSTAGTSHVTVTVTDKRGRSGITTYDMNVQDYTAPAISKLTVRRCDADGTENDQGEYCQVVFSAAVSGMNAKNTATYAVRHKTTTGSTWTEVAIDALDNKYAVSNQTQIFAADGNYSHVVEVVVTDRHGTATRSTSVSTAFTLYNCHPSGTGWRFGGVADKKNTLQNDLTMCQMGNSYTSQSTNVGGVKGYICLAQITLTKSTVDAPIVFTISKRNAFCPMTLYVRFASTTSTADPDLRSFTYEGENFGAFLIKTATSTWKLYVDNVAFTWGRPCIQNWYTIESQMARMTVNFIEEMVEGEEPNVLGTYYRAVPAKMQSILDFIYPVGSIYLSYSHVNPTELFGGTWVRIENAFLWAAGADGTIGQTGGEKTHTLTVNELPVHSHGSVYSQNAAGTKSQAWYSTSGDKLAYGVVETGGGAAHNNMPPYIQVSVWRRTA